MHLDQQLVLVALELRLQPLEQQQVLVPEHHRCSCCMEQEQEQPFRS